MTRWALFALLIVAAIVIWFFESRGSLEIRTPKRCAREFSEYVHQHDRFSNVTIRVLEIGSKGPLYVSGNVASDREAAELRTQLIAMCSVGVSWQIVVDTNLAQPNLNR